MDSRNSSLRASNPGWALLVGLLALRGLDLGLASSAPVQSPLGLRFWLTILGVIAGIWFLQRVAVQRLPPRWRSGVASVLGPILVLSLPFLVGITGYDPQKRALADLLHLALVLLATWSCALEPNGRWIQRLALIAFGLCAILAWTEQALGHPLITLAPRALLQGALLCVVLAKLFAALSSKQPFELRASAALLAAPLLARLVAVGSWTALLGVPVPEAHCAYTLAIWGVCTLGLCATTFPRGKGPSVLSFALGAALSVALVFLIYLHYLKRFGRIQAKFDAVSLPLLGLHFPYPEWQSTAASSVFAVSVIFAVVLILRCLGQSSTRKQGLALALWFCAGIGLHRGLDLMCLALALDQLQSAFSTQLKPGPDLEH